MKMTMYHYLLAALVVLVALYFLLPFFRGSASPEAIEAGEASEAGVVEGIQVNSQTADEG